MRYSGCFTRNIWHVCCITNEQSSNIPTGGNGNERYLRWNYCKYHRKRRIFSDPFYRDLFLYYCRMPLFKNVRKSISKTGFRKGGNSLHFPKHSWAHPEIFPKKILRYEYGCLRKKESALTTICHRKKPCPIGRDELERIYLYSGCHGLLAGKQQKWELKSPWKVVFRA